MLLLPNYENNDISDGTNNSVFKDSTFDPVVLKY